MEWSLPVNEMLRDDVTKLTHAFIPPRFHGDIHALRLTQDSLSHVINALGDLSAAEQGLSKVITTAEKLRNSPSHILYLLKDAHAKGGKGEVIGMLKMGRKHLFLFDERDKVREVEPLCVLDFFVLRDRQRCGVGRKLFDYMLNDLDVRTEQLAVDGPSSKMEQFLLKNYGVERLLRQNNNFAVAPSFFDYNEDVSSSGRSTPSCTERAVVPTLGRFAAHKPPSAIANVIHGGGAGSLYYETSSGKASRAQSPPPEEMELVPDAVPVQPGEMISVLEETLIQKETFVMEDAPNLERPTSLHVETVEAPAAVASAQRDFSPAGYSLVRRDSQLTDRGFFDIKFYHNKLW